MQQEKRPNIVMRFEEIEIHINASNNLTMHHSLLQKIEHKVEKILKDPRHRVPTESFLWRQGPCLCTG